MAKGQPRVSVLVVEEAFASGDSRFLEYFEQLDGQSATRVVEKWKRDHRPWAREQFLKYLEQARVYGGYSRLVAKRFFKHADATGDDALMAVFLRFFDKQVRRVRR